MAQPDASPSKLERRFHGCSSIRDYEIIGKLGEGTFGEVHKARVRRNGRIVALKKILMHNEKDGFPITALREIKLLKLLSHVNVLRLDEMAIERKPGEGRKRAILYMVTPYMDHDLSGLLDNTDVRITEPMIKCYMLQLLEGLRYLHDSHIMHRDMKAANLLINNSGILQIGDFGLARHYDEPVPKAGRAIGEARRDYTTLVVTRWYRPPELLLQLRRYTTAIDMWGAGCVFGEMFKRKPILTGTSDLNQAQLIFDLMGAPNDENMPGWNSLPGCEGVRNFGGSSGKLRERFKDLNSSALDLLSSLLSLSWRTRITAIDALEHPYFKTEPLPARPQDLPWFADSHELDRRNARGQKGAPPPAPAGGTVGMGPNGDWVGPPPQGQPNGAAFGNGDRNPRSGRPDRPPGSGPPPRGHGSRVPQGSHDHRGPPGRRPWDQQENAPPPRHPLPANPHTGHAPAYRPSNNAKKDTYVPSYNGSGGQRRDDRRSRESEERPSRERDIRSRGGDRGDRRDVASNDRRNTRSRSPARRENRDRVRERDIYRR